MRIASNKIVDVVRFFRDELRNIYDEGEIETFITYCFDEYIGMKRAAIALHGNSTISESELLKFNFAVKDLKKHKPIQYILGKADFYGLKFKVNEHVLIPRPETEELVHTMILDQKIEDGRWKMKDGIRPVTIIDIGTGSGCIAIALKKNISAAAVFGLDISEEALEVAKQNALYNNVDIQFIKYDILSNAVFPKVDLKFDIIVSNPPYITGSEKEKMDKNVTDYEPHLALFVNDMDPLLFYKSIVRFALQHLNKNGKIYFEINQGLGIETRQILIDVGFKNIELIKDLNSNFRILRGQLSK